MAEGTQRNAQLDSVAVLRKLNKKIVATRVDVASALALREGGTQFYLAPDDIVYVPATTLSTSAEIMEDFRKLILFRGWGISFERNDLHF